MFGNQGHVTGIDCCPDFIHLARSEQHQSGLRNVDFQVGDVEAELPQSQFDMVFSRFGTMFFTNPVKGLRNLHNALRPNGRMTQIVWRARDENPWLAAARSVLLTHLPQPNADAPSCGPGPFSMADPELVKLQMTAAGFTGIRFEKIDAPVMIGRTIDEAIAFQLALGPAGEIFRSAGNAADLKRSAIEADLRDMFALASCDETGIWMQSASWLITAHRGTQTG